MNSADPLRPQAALAANPRAPGEVLSSNTISLQNLPMLPAAGVKALALAKDPGTSFRELAVVIQRDPALATGILKLANSPLYGLGREVSSLEQAILRLGFRECQNVILTVALRSLYRKLPPSRKQRCEALWKHAFITACASRRLNQALRLSFQGEEFSCGLCHDIGRTLLAIGAPAYFDLADPLSFREGPDVLAHERGVLGTDHCAFGAWFAHVNELPAAVIAAVKYHHEPAEAAEHRRLVTSIALADDMANHLQCEGTPDGYDPAAGIAWPLLQAEEPDATRQFQATAQATLKDVAREVSEVFSFSIG